MCVRIYNDQLRLFSWSRSMDASIEESWDYESHFPGSIAPILVENESKRRLIGARWGLIPPWAPDGSYGKKRAVNARSETLAEKPTFAQAFLERRCLVPASEFFEQLNGRWFRFNSAHDVFPIAGLFEPPNRHCEIPTFTVITCPPNNQVSPYQDRMPVVLCADDIEAWLNPNTPISELQRLFEPCPDEWMTVEDAGSNRKTETKRQGDLFDL